MTANQFFDTNILIYAFDSSDVAKQQIAKQCIAQAATAATGMISTQVLGEFFHATVIRRRLLTVAEATRAIDAFQDAFVIASIDRALVAEAIDVHQRHQLRYWDSLIVATANRSDCQRIVSEDLNHGQSYNGSVVRNPFRAETRE